MSEARRDIQGHGLFLPHTSHWGVFSARMRDGQLEVRPYALKASNRDLFEEDLQPVNGRLAVPTAPGFGMTLRKDAERRMTVAQVALK